MTPDRAWSLLLAVSLALAGCSTASGTTLSSGASNKPAVKVASGLGTVSAGAAIPVREPPRFRCALLGAD